MADLTDPDTSTNADLSRRTFLGVAAGAAALGATMTHVLADDQRFGTFHDPIVKEDDPDINVERAALARRDGSISAYAAYPRAVSKTTPGVVIAQHVWGVDAHIRDVVRRFAKAGYVTIAPDLYARFNAPSGDSATDFTIFRDYAQKLVDAQVDGDLEAAALWIRARVGSGPAQRPPKIGVTGFCMGGAIALRQSVDSQAYDAAAIWYGKVRLGPSGGPPTEMSLAYADEIRVPLLGSFGARDSSIPVEDVRALQARLKVPNDVKIYENAGHAFFDDQRSAYVASAAADAWNRTLAWFARYLRA